jgi:hypothetical protein
MRGWVDEHQLPLVILTLVVIGLLVLAVLALKPAARRVLRRRWRPKTPRDCPLCETQPRPERIDMLEVTPWSLRRSRRGEKKRVDSEGFACSNPKCAYFGCTVASVHALVSNGWHGKRERIQCWQCQACGTRVTARWGTPMFQLKTPSWRVAEVMAAACEGVDESALHRVFRHDRCTIRRWRPMTGLP